MKKLFFLFLTLATVLSAEEEPRRRRRIIVYDQRPSLIPVERPALTESTDGTEERKRRLRQETGVLSGSSSGGTPLDLDLMPLMPLTPAMPDTSSEEDEEEEDWITAEDLMSEEDLLDSELPTAESGENVEMEIMDWEDLQAQLIDSEMESENTEAQAETGESQEEILREEARRFARTEDQDSGGIVMENLLEQSDSRAGEPDAPVSGNGNPTAPPGMRPVLASALQMDGEATRPEPPPTPDADARPALAGSRKLLEDIQNRWDPRRNSPSEPVADRSPAEVSAPGLSGLQRPLLNTGSLTGPAVSLPQSVAPSNTGALMRSASPPPRMSTSPRQSPPASQPPSRTLTPPRDDFRIRSRLGAGDGL